MARSARSSVPLAYAPQYGMVAGRLGILWILDVLAPCTGGSPRRGEDRLVSTPARASEGRGSGYLIARAFTGEPAPPVMGSGAAESRNS